MSVNVNLLTRLIYLESLSHLSELNDTEPSLYTRGVGVDLEEINLISVLFANKRG